MNDYVIHDLMYSKVAFYSERGHQIVLLKIMTFFDKYRPCPKIPPGNKDTHGEMIMGEDYVTPGMACVNKGKIIYLKEFSRLYDDIDLSSVETCCRIIQQILHIEYLIQITFLRIEDND